MNIPLYQIDAFAGKPFEGNPAAVCPLPDWIEPSLMQAIAAENNLSETAFFVPFKDTFQLKWFTPLAEVDLCGHATLASAHVIFNHLEYRSDKVEFETQSGPLKVTRKDNLLEMDFPSRPGVDTPPPAGFLDGLGREPGRILKSRDWMAVYESEADVLGIKPDFVRLLAATTDSVIITAPGETVDFVSRFFAPAEGIPEDPVTGSAHCTLIPYWADRLGRSTLRARQVSRRGGELFCSLDGDRVTIAGQAITYLVGEITV